MATTETIIELILRLNIAGIPVKVRGSVEGGEFRELSGRVTIQKSLKDFLEALGADFGPSTAILKQLTGNSHIKLDSLAFGYRNREPKFAQVAVTLTAGDSRCRFVCLKQVGKDQSGFVAGLELRLDKALFKDNPLSGLVGEISLGDVGIYYASDAFQNVKYDTGQDFQDADKLPLRSEPTAIKARDFTKGMNWSAQVLVRGINLLDWSGTKEETKPGPESRERPQEGGTGKKAEPPRLTGPTTWINTNKSLGPLSVRRIGLSYEAPRVAIKFDAGLQLSVLTFSLEGLGLSYPLDQFTDLTAEEFLKNLQFQLDGAAVTFEQGPLTISGGLLKVQKPYLQLDGVLLIRVPGINISAMASYADLSGTPTFFAFAALLMEFGDPTGTGFFFVTGLAFGFGVNRALKLPTINEVQNFPLINAAKDPADFLGAKMDLRVISQRLGEYMSPAIGQLWIAAGVKFTSYGLIDSFALLSVSFGTQFEVTLLGISKIQIPKPPAAVLAYAELAISVVIAPESGLLSFEARLTENSYLLRKDFKLRGGFAFYTWFAGEHEGDFVVTIGGYHPRFKPPAHYPKPDLVEFACKISDAVAIRGYCYFALCPSAIMAGGGLSIVYQSGGLRAWFIAQADFLIQWKPLYYDILIGVSIGVALRLHVGVIRIHMALELSAMVALHGPPLGGIARISVLFLSIEIKFGEDRRIAPPLLWESQDPEKSFAKAFLANPKVTIIAITDGLLKEIRMKNEAGDEISNYYISPQKLVLSARTQVPATDVLFNGGPLNDGNGGALPLPKPKVDKKDTTLGVRATGQPTMYSLVNIALKPESSSAEAEQYLQQYLEMSLTTKSVPSALWGQPIGEQERNKVPAANEQMIDDALVGIEIKTKAGPRPWETPALDLDVLAYDRFPRPFDWRKPKPAGALSGYDGKTISNTIAAPDVVKLRSGILTELARTGRKIMKPEDIHLDELSQNAQHIFQDMPEMARVGQYPPRGYPEVISG